MIVHIPEDQTKTYAAIFVNKRKQPVMMYFMVTRLWYGFINSRQLFKDNDEDYTKIIVYKKSVKLTNSARRSVSHMPGEGKVKDIQMFEKQYMSFIWLTRRFTQLNISDMIVSYTNFMVCKQNWELENSTLFFD